MFSEKLLAWYDQEKRDLPWRNKIPNPYHTWLSEIMLQQTTVATVIPYFKEFLNKWPTLQDLAAASLDEVLVKWQGLGYYSRARNLHKCAQDLAHHFPCKEEELSKLPGIGPYTAAAIASIAFDQKAAAVDGNVVRVISRYLAISKPKPIEEVKERLKTLLPDKRCGDFTQALMELGALICRPKNPSCSSCPFLRDCKAYALGKAEDFPLKAPKQKLPTRYATAFIVRREDGAILIRKRPPQGLLGGMMEVPTTPWEEIKKTGKGPVVRHTFTHFHFEVEVCHLDDPSGFEGIWVHPRELQNYALPTVMKKIIKAGLIIR
ncbi:MAG: A/G-specific adenine glycosylase [Alphaproteobacteria bacterium 41-28]|nr:MAG: A/G-specific adenine glycosylase [Alphaproteobacteria bacterium 41-28]